MTTKIKNKKKSSYPSIVFLAICVIILAFTVLLVQNVKKPQDIRNRAASSSNPCQANCNVNISIGCTRTKRFGFFTFSYTDPTCQQRIYTSCIAKCTLLLRPSPTKRPIPTRRPTSTPRPTFVPKTIHY